MSWSAADLGSGRAFPEGESRVILGAPLNITLSLLAASVILPFISPTASSQLASRFYAPKLNLPQDPTMAVGPEDPIFCADELDHGPYTETVDPRPNAFRYTKLRAQSNSALVDGGCDGFNGNQSE